MARVNGSREVGLQHVVQNELILASSEHKSFNRSFVRHSIDGALDISSNYGRWCAGVDIGRSAGSPKLLTLHCPCR